MHLGASVCSSAEAAELMLLVSSIISMWCVIKPLILLSSMLVKVSLYAFWFAFRLKSYVRFWWSDFSLEKLLLTCCLQLTLWLNFVIFGAIYFQYYWASNLIHNLVWYPSFLNLVPIRDQLPRPGDSGDRLKWKNVFSQTRHELCFFSVMIGVRTCDNFQEKHFFHYFSLERLSWNVVGLINDGFFWEFLWLAWKYILRWSNDKFMRFCIMTIAWLPVLRCFVGGVSWTISWAAISLKFYFKDVSDSLDASWQKNSKRTTLIWKF